MKLIIGNLFIKSLILVNTNMGDFFMEKNFLNNSLWLNSSNIKSYPPLANNLNVDVCIIGGGITGLSCGYYLTKNELNVCVLEKDSIMSKTSGHTTAKITSQHGLIYKYLFDSYGKDLAQKYLNSNQQAITNIKNIIDLENIECDFDFENHYIYTTDANSIKKLKDEFNILRKLNYDARIINKVDLPISNIKAALEFNHQAKFNPVKYANGLSNYITNHSGLIFENSKVIKLEKSKDTYKIFSNGNIITSKYVIITTRYPIINFPGLYFLKMYSETSNLIAVETSSQLFKGMYINIDTPTFSFRTSSYNGKPIFLVGGLNHKTGSKIDLSNSYNLLEQKALDLYPDSKVLFKWNTHDSVSLDKIPYIGNFSNFYPNVYVATGFKKWGMTTSNVAANIINDMILKKENNYADIYTATRLRPIKNRKEFTNIIKESSHSLILNKFDIPAARKEDINVNKGKIVNENGKKIGIYKDKNNIEYKVIPVCTHLGCELSWNNLDKTWDCPCHGSRYTYEGKLLYGPSKKDLKTLK